MHVCVICVICDVCAPPVPMVYACAGDNVPDNERAGMHTLYCHVIVT